MAKVNFKPQRDWILLPSPRKETTDSGIYIPKSEQTDIDSRITKVVAAGPDATVKEGDTVYLHSEASWMPIELEGVEYALVNMYAIVGVIEPK